MLQLDFFLLELLLLLFLVLAFDLGLFSARAFEALESPLVLLELRFELSSLCLARDCGLKTLLQALELILFLDGFVFNLLILLDFTQYWRKLGSTTAQHAVVSVGVTKYSYAIESLKPVFHGNEFCCLRVLGYKGLPKEIGHRRLKLIVKVKEIKGQLNLATSQLFHLFDHLIIHDSELQFV